jgi:hypothetical protein
MTEDERYYREKLARGEISRIIPIQLLLLRNNMAARDDDLMTEEDWLPKLKRIRKES